MTIQVFVSYRREDSPHAAGRLVDRLDEHFKLFIDVDRIRPGADFTSWSARRLTRATSWLR